ncbi:MAG: ATP-binding protein [Deltaproteobacteria bacterium]|nr:ATP-binding protein [Deltaproteobacteria bacterium]
MKELTVISGKGGTGKTSIAASFAFLAKNRVLADCDVDAADLHILAQPEIIHQEDFFGGKKAVIDHDKCSLCGICKENCRYSAISASFVVDHTACEGCALCHYLCPESAITMEETLNGKWFISNTRFGPMVHANLIPGEENSGKLVALVRNQAKLIAEERNMDIVIVDGAPGVGCPVISSITGVDHVVVVTEPTMSGLHDMKRAAELVRHFNIPISLVINKWDIHPGMTAEIEEFAKSGNISLAGKIPYDRAVTDSMVKRRTVVEEGPGPASDAIIKVWDQLNQRIWK